MGPGLEGGARSRTGMMKDLAVEASAIPLTNLLNYDKELVLP